MSELKDTLNAHIAKMLERMDGATEDTKELCEMNNRLIFLHGSASAVRMRGLLDALTGKLLGKVNGEDDEST
jgi:hypothetical protein